LSAPTTWKDYESIVAKAYVDKLEKLYGHPENVDLWLGALLEQKVPGGDIGPTFLCIMLEGAKNWRNGDRYVIMKNPLVF
jgi:peroxidase